MATSRRPAGPAGTWQPIATGELAERARRTTDQIAVRLAAGCELDLVTDCTLANGGAGVAIALAHLDGVQAAEPWLDRAAAQLAHAHLGPGLYEGFAGVGWAVAHVAATFGADAGSELGAVDDAVFSWVEAPRPRREFDLTAGLVGCGVYALERLPSSDAERCLAAVVDGLAQLAEPAAGGLCWRSPQGERCDLGMAHGTAGVVALLASARAAGLVEDSAAELTEWAVGWLLAQALDAGGFPYWVGPHESREPARLAWCYGELGIAAAILRAAESFGETRWRQAAIAIARSAARRAVAESGVVDAGLCHGAAGVAHVLARIAAVAGDAEISDAAAFWLEHALMLGPAAEAGLLTGAAGMALALRAATSDAEPGWDRFLLLGSPVLA